MTAAAEPPRRKDAGVGVRLRQLRKERGLTVAEVARRLHVHESVVRRLELGMHDPTVGKVRRYCDAIGARIHIGLDGPTRPTTTARRNP
ncbi:helix-turn-helix transcriptional regulator [Amycolatopsis sp. NPDC051128]|uniref:helix-turn-helix domain-containing protein n=1 Tax=Amycolatopsis sp. NPDC051128 TaxID=3155412 RepID=UPI003436115C